MTTTTPADPTAAPPACVADLIVVVPVAELSAAVDDVLCGTTITALGPSDRLEAECIGSATCDRPVGAYRPVFVATSAATILSDAPLVATLRASLATNHIPIALADPDHDHDIIWGHVFDAGLLANPLSAQGLSSGEPPLVDTITKATGHRTGVAPLRIVRDGPEALARWLAFDNATDHVFTLIDGAGRSDLTTVARTIAHRPLIAGTPALLSELLRQGSRKH